MYTFFGFLLSATILFAGTGCFGASKNPSKKIDLKVFHFKTPCMGEGVRLCYWVSKDGKEPEYFFDEIQGFVYEWGYNYELRIEESAVENPMADASSLSYKLLEVVRKERVGPATTFELPVTLDGQSLVQTGEQGCSYFGDVTIMTQGFTCAELAAASSALFRHGETEPGLVLVEIR